MTDSTPSRRAVIAATAAASVLPLSDATAAPERVAGKDRVRDWFYWRIRALLTDTELHPADAQDMAAVKASVLAALNDVAVHVRDAKVSVRAVELQFLAEK